MAEFQIEYIIGGEKYSPEDFLEKKAEYENWCVKLEENALREYYNMKISLQHMKD